MKEQYGPLMSAVRRQIARELRRVRAGNKPATAWDTCVVVASAFSRTSIAYRTAREVGIKFKPSHNVVIGEG